MISSDQPECFPSELLVAVSSRLDGTVLDRLKDTQSPGVVVNRIEFCKKAGTSYDKMVYQQIIYGEDQTYDKIIEVDEHMTTPHLIGVMADAMLTSQPGVGLFLPVADCVATVFYDPKLKQLALAHIGRHASYAKLASKLAERLNAGGSNLTDVIVWMSPHVGKDSYVLDWFDKKDDDDWQGFYTQKQDGFYLDMAGYNRQLLTKAGIPSRNIYTSPIDTAKDDKYFSHSKGDKSGRIAVIAQIK